MPKESMNYYIMMSNGSYERTLVSLADKTRALDKETQQLQRTTEGFAKANKTLLAEQTRLQSELKSSTKTVNELQKAYDECGDELSKMQLDKAIENHAKLKQELSEVNAQVNFNQRTYKDYLEQMRKGSLGEAGGEMSKSEKLGMVADGLDVWGQVSSLAQSAVGTGLESMLGSSAGGIATGALSSAISGAAIGTAIAPGVGTAAGAAIGGALGAVGGVIEEWGSKDDAFKAYYGGLYEDVKDRSGEMVESGSALAGERETERVTAAAQALEQMKSSDAELQNHLDTLNGLGIDAVGMLAEAKSVDKERINEMISNEEISGTEAAELISTALEKAYPGGVEDHTFEGLSSKLEGLEQELDIAGGEGYNDLRSSGKSDMVDAYNGELGDSIKEINRVMGENQARKENYQDQYMREVLDMVLNGNQGSLWSAFDQKQREDLTNLRQDFKDAEARYESSGRMDEEAAAQMQALYETARTMGEAYYDNSEFAQMLHETELDEIEMIRENTAGLEAATQAAYDIQQELSRGIVATIKLPSGIAVQGGGAGSSIAQGSSVDYDAINGLTPEEIGALGVGGKRWDPGTVGSFVPHAYGLARVPYDEYPALLHEGERVLTASQARAQDAGQGAAPISITITGNSFTGMPEEMADQLAEIIARRLEQAAIAAAPR